MGLGKKIKKKVKTQLMFDSHVNFTKREPKKGWPTGGFPDFIHMSWFD